MARPAPSPAPATLPPELQSLVIWLARTRATRDAAEARSPAPEQRP